MYCTKLSYKNYRSIENASIDLVNGVNVFFGDNAKGKTNLLEGIYYFAYGKSFRGAKDKELIRFNEDSASICMNFTDNLRDRKHEVRFSSNGKKYCFKEDIKISKMSEFIGLFRAVLFSPEHLSIVKDGPSERRIFLDIAISQLYPEYLMSLSRYQKILSERNTLLKNPEDIVFKDLISVYSERLAKENALISEYRDKYISKLNTQVGNIISDMTKGTEKTLLEYDKRKTEEEYLNLLTSNLEKEIYAGTTL